MSDASSLNGQTSTNNVLSFSATVAENTNKSNYSGLDVSTAKAYVDGVEVGCSINNGLISAEKLTLANGTHTVKFSICDKMGNYSSIIRQININAANSASTIMVRPHDATLNRILFGSLYYVDVVATDIEKVQSVTTVLDLNNISVWNLEHMDVAEGFEAEYTIIADENIATVTITRSGKNDSTGEGVLVSMPIRTWELKMGYVYENGVKKGMQAFTYKNFRDMKEFWWIDINVEIDKGVVTFVDGTTGTFSGKKVSVDTEMWAEDGDMIASTNTEGVAYYNTWNGGHIHTAEALENKAATCTQAGYIDRTFCKVCNSVVEWGTTVKATGHTYEVEDGVLKCKDCDKLFNGELDGKTYVDGIALDGWVGDKYYKDGAMLTGVKAVEGVYYNFGEDGVSKGVYTGDFTGEDGKHYYAKLGALVGGWFTINDEWYYFDETTFAGVSGEYVYSKFSYITYNFDEDGKLTEGVWYHDGTGYRYYYGPDYYKNGFQTIDGKTYAFLDNIRLEGGVYRIKYSQSAEGWQLAKFDENGVYLGDVEGEGLVDCVNGLYYYVDGKPQSGLAKVDGNYYYFNNIDLKAVKDCKYKVSNRNGITDLPYGEYEFDSEGKLIHKNGVYVSGSNYYYYENSKKTNAGLVKVGDDYYYSKDNGLIAVSGTYTVTKTSCDLPAGEKYKFGADGKMLDGLVDEGKYTFYYENGKRVKAGIVEIDGDYYYIDDNCLPKRSGTYTVKKSTVAEVPVGAKCKFDADGKMYNGVYEEGTVGNRYYYEFGKRVEAGVVEVDGEYYYARTGGLCAKNGTFTVTKSSVAGVEEGDKCRVHEDARVYNGIEEVNGNLYYYSVGKRVAAGLVKVDGDYYFTKDGGLVAVNGTFTVNTTSCDLPAGEKYKFGADGKMLQGVVAEGTAGNSYYYVNGKRVAAGLVEFDGNIYYAKDGGLVAKNGSYKATDSTVEGLETGVNYKFDKDGKAYQGLVDEGQNTYYYENGRRVYAGLVKVDGDYYCVNKSGIVIKGEESAPVITSCDLPAGVGIKYSFGADGKMLQGIVDGYYYKNGQLTYAGLVQIGEDYYYIGKDFKPVCGKSQFAYYTDCDLAGGVSYTFGADGKMVK
ncbi:MAG: hypothetical protein IJD90_04680 [Clostridia bacterium]|nr:hypothetical protein [Clostridia bacterium]